MNPSPSTVAPAEPPAKAGFSLPLDIIAAPNRAFAKIAATREWLPAAAVIVLATLAMTALQGPALVHVAALSPPPAGETAPHTPAEVAAAERALVATYAFGQVAITTLLVLLTASALTTVARFKAQSTPYLTYVSLAANCLIPSMIGGLISSALIRTHDPASFRDLHSLLVAVPTNLAVFANPANEREVTFLGRFDIFDVWSYTLLAAGFAATTPVKFTTALILAFGLDFAFAVMF